ncbi:hypothetical protein ACJX0J_006940, partial [Zea mays]
EYCLYKYIQIFYFLTLKKNPNEMMKKTLKVVGAENIKSYDGDCMYLPMENEINQMIKAQLEKTIKICGIFVCMFHLTHSTVVEFSSKSWNLSWGGGGGGGDLSFRQGRRQVSLFGHEGGTMLQDQTEHFLYTTRAAIRNKINISEKGIFFIIFKQKRQEIMDHVVWKKKNILNKKIAIEIQFKVVQTFFFTLLVLVFSKIPNDFFCFAFNPCIQGLHTLSSLDAFKDEDGS